MTGTNPLLKSNEGSDKREEFRAKVSQRLFETIAQEYGFDIGGYVEMNERVARCLIDGAQAAAVVAARLAVAVGMSRFEFSAACGEEFIGEAELDVMREAGKKAQKC